MMLEQAEAAHSRVRGSAPARAHTALRDSTNAHGPAGARAARKQPSPVINRIVNRDAGM
jgi:hypothetical protein